MVWIDQVLIEDGQSSKNKSKSIRSILLLNVGIGFIQYSGVLMGFLVLRH